MLISSVYLKSVTAPEERERLLLRMLARVLLVNGFEQAEASIWATQLDLLAFLNSRRQGDVLEQLKALFYDKAAAQYPQMYQHYTFQQWMEFSQRNRLISIGPESALISDEGIEYLTWRLQQARPPKLEWLAKIPDSK